MRGWTCDTTWDTMSDWSEEEEEEEEEGARTVKVF
jgi:hypothetical protein